MISSGVCMSTCRETGASQRGIAFIDLCISKQRTAPLWRLSEKNSLKVGVDQRRSLWWKAPTLPGMICRNRGSIRRSWRDYAHNEAVILDLGSSGAKRRSLIYGHPE